MAYAINGSNMKLALSLILVVALFYTFQNAMIRSERAECIKWQAEEKEYQAWYSTGWMKDQCAQFQITFTK